MQWQKAFFLLAGIFLFACGKKRETSPADAVPPGAGAAPSGPVFQAPDPFKIELGRVYSGYLQIQEALAADDLPAAQSAFSGMHGVLHVLQPDGLDSAAKAYWDAGNARFMEILHPMAASGTIDSMRLHFMDFTPALLDAIDRFGVSSTPPIYLFHCPMARDHQGAEWLQKDTLPANPFFGKSMLACGSLIRKVKT